MSDEFQVSELSMFQFSHSVLAPSHATITALALSSGGNHLAIGDINGDVMILQLPSQRVVRRHRTRSSIRALVWHSSETNLYLLAATSNGFLFIWKEEVELSKLVRYHRYNGSVHAAAITIGATYLAVSAGYAVYIYEDPLADHRDTLPDPLIVLDAPAAKPGYTSFISNPIAHQLEALEDGTLLIGYLAGICIIPLHPPYEILFNGPSRLPALIGRFAVSPSQRCVAITNLANGLDLFSLDSRKYVSKSNYLLDSFTGSDSVINRTLEAAFLNDKILAAGHADASLFLFSMDTDGIQESFRIDFPNGEANSGTQLVVAGYVDGAPLIIAVNGRGLRCTLNFIKQVRPAVSHERKLLLAPSALSYRGNAASTHPVQREHAQAEASTSDCDLSDSDTSTSEMRQSLKTPRRTPGGCNALVCIVIFLMALWLSLGYIEGPSLA